MAETGHYSGMHLGNPDIDFVGLAKSQSVDGEKVTSASDLPRALDRGIAATRAGSPYVMDVAIAQVGGGAQILLGGTIVWTSRAVLPATAHVATGALLLATAWVLTLRTYLHLEPPDEV